MADRPQLGLVEIVELTAETLRCTVRCLDGTVRLNDTVHLRPATDPRPLAENLTITAIEYAGDIPMEFVDRGHTALITVTGRLDVPKIRAVTPENDPAHVVRANLRLTVR